MGMDHLKKYQPSLIAIAGPTATGKSSLAITLAQRLGSPILNADSRQVYRELNIGTAKPTLQDQQGVPHYLLDICEPTETFTLAQYQQQAQALIQRFQTQGHIPILVGGTGLYLRAVTQGLKIPPVAPQPELRSQLQSLGQSHIYAWLQQVDAAAAARIHPHDQVRTLRALEVFYVTGQPLSQQQTNEPPTYPILHIGLDCPDLQVFTERLYRRTHQMIAAGWVAEVEQLVTKYGSALPLLQTLGYQELLHHLQGQSTLAEAIEQTVIHTRQFAKRQRTWFRSEPQMQWFDITQADYLDQVWAQIDLFCRLKL